MVLSGKLPSLPALLVFESAARHRNFTAAARELGSSQSAVSQQIKALEHELGVVLFERVYRGVVLTEQGDALLESVSRGFQDIVGCVESLRARGNRSTLNVATDFAFAAFWLMPRLPVFQQQHPEIDVRIITVQERQLLRGPDTDVAILFDTPAIDGTAIPLFRETVFPVCSPGFLSQHKPITTMRELLSLPRLTLQPKEDQYWLDWDGFLLAHKSRAKNRDSVLTLSNYTLLIQAVIAGGGVGLGWQHLLDDLLAQGILTALTPFSVSSQNGYFALDSNPLQASESKAVFLEWLQVEAGEGA